MGIKDHASLCADLRAAEPALREKAARMLGRTGGRAVSAIPLLVGALQDAVPRVRAEAAEALGRICGEPHGTVPALVEALADSERDVREAAAWALGKFGPVAREAIPGLISAGQDDMAYGNVTDTGVCAIALVQIGADGIPELLDSLGPAAEEGSSFVVDVMEGRGTRAIPDLAATLKSENVALQAAAAAALGRLGPSAKATVPALVELLAGIRRGESDGADVDAWKPLLDVADKGIDHCAAVSLLCIGREAAPALVEALCHEDARIRRNAAIVLAAMQGQAVPSLQRALDASEAEWRQAALDVVAEMDRTGPGIRSLAPALERILSQATGSARLSALKAIQKMAPVGGPAASTMRCIYEGARDASANIRKEAVWALVAFLEKCPATISGACDVLLAASRDDDSEVREAAIVGLRFAAHDDAAVLSVLLEAMKDEDVSIRISAGSSLRHLPGGCESAGVAALVAKLEDDEPRMRVDLLEILESLGPKAAGAADVVERLLEGGDMGVRLHAVSALAAIVPESALPLPVVRDALASREWRRDAIGIVVKLGCRGRELVPGLCASLKEAHEDHDEDLCGITIRALASIGPAAGIALPAILDALGSLAGDDDECWHVDYDMQQEIWQWLLVGLSSWPAEAAEALADVLKKGTRAQRITAVRVLAKLGPVAAPASKGLVDALCSEDRELRSEAIGALEQIGAAAVPALPELTRLLDAQDDDIRTLAARAMTRVGSTKATLPRLLVLVRDGKEGERIDAARCVGGLGADARTAVPLLLEAIELGRSQLAGAAAHALARVDPQALQVSTLRVLCADRRESVRTEAVGCLSCPGLDGQDTLDDLIAALEDPARGVRQAALSGLARRGSAAGAAVPAIVRVLKDVGLHSSEFANELAAWLRAEAAWTLGRIGSPARKAIPELMIALDDLHESVRWEAARALVALGSGDTPEVVWILRECCRSTQPKIRIGAAKMLAEM